MWKHISSTDWTSFITAVDRSPSDWTDRSRGVQTLALTNVQRSRSITHDLHRGACSWLWRSLAWQYHPMNSPTWRQIPVRRHRVMGVLLTIIQWHNSKRLASINTPTVEHQIYKANQIKSNRLFEAKRQFSHIMMQISNASGRHINKGPVSNFTLL